MYRLTSVPTDRNIHCVNVFLRAYKQKLLKDNILGLLDLLWVQVDRCLQISPEKVKRDKIIYV